MEKGATLPLSMDAKNNLPKLISYDANQNPTPKGHIVSGMTGDQSRRPLCFIYSGNSSENDGKDIS